MAPFLSMIWDVPSANMHAFDSAVLIRLVDLQYIKVWSKLLLCGIEIMWRRKAQISALGHQFAKIAAPMTNIIFIIFAIILSKLNVLYVSMFTINNAAQDMKRSF